MIFSIIFFPFPKKIESFLFLKHENQHQNRNREREKMFKNKSVDVGDCSCATSINLIKVLIGYLCLSSCLRFED
jgi:hypothetical protein